MRHLDPMPGTARNLERLLDDAVALVAEHEGTLDRPCVVLTGFADERNAVVTTGR
jgi:hypothetical protein